MLFSIIHKSLFGFPMTKNKINGSCICSTGTVWSFQNILRNSRGNGSCQGMSGMFMSTPLILGSSLQSGRKQAVSFPIAMQPLVSIWNYFFSARLRPDKITFASIEIGCFPMFLHLRTFSWIAHFCQPCPPHHHDAVTSDLTAADVSLKGKGAKGSRWSEQWLQGSPNKKQSAWAQTGIPPPPQKKGGGGVNACSSGGGHIYY